MARIKFKILEQMDKRDMRHIKDLHKETGISETVLQGLISGKRQGVRLETLMRLCNFFKCEIEDLVEIKKE